MGKSQSGKCISSVIKLSVSNHHSVAFWQNDCKAKQCAPSLQMTTEIMLNFWCSLAGSVGGILAPCINRERLQNPVQLLFHKVLTNSTVDLVAHGCITCWGLSHVQITIFFMQTPVRTSDVPLWFSKHNWGLRYNDITSF